MQCGYTASAAELGKTPSVAVETFNPYIFIAIEESERQVAECHVGNAKEAGVFQNDSASISQKEGSVEKKDGRFRQIPCTQEEICGKGQGDHIGAMEMARLAEKFNWGALP